MQNLGGKQSVLWAIGKQSMAGHGNDERDHDYVDVVNIGANDDDSEVTMFYRPYKGLNFHCPQIERFKIMIV